MTKRYTAVAIVLHWAIAVAIVGNILLGWWMHNAIEEAGTQARAIATYQLHKSIGLTVLVLSLVRLGWRLSHPPPPLPDAMPAWEKIAAKATHWAFYALMVAIPLAGWLYVSAGWSAHNDRPLNVPTLYFGLFQVPHLFGLEHAATEVRRSVAGFAIETHEWLAWGALILLALHVAAALKHQFVDRDEVLSHMVPSVKSPNETAPPPRDPRRAATLAGGFAAILLAAIGIGVAIASVPIKQGSVAEASAPPADAQPAEESSGAPVIPTAAEQPVAPAQQQIAQAAQPKQAPRAAAAPSAWRVDQGASEIAFSGVHAGTPFRGRFSRWRADIRFDPANLAQSSATVTIETASAADGISLHDQSLPAAEWFDTANHPTATYRATRFQHGQGDSYTAIGSLTIKGRAVPVSLPFTLAINGDRATMSGRARLDRTAANLGMESDPNAEFVSREITIDVRVAATRAQ